MPAKKRSGDCRKGKENAALADQAGSVSMDIARSALIGRSQLFFQPSL
jgi:hypothetical protein